MLMIAAAYFCVIRINGNILDECPVDFELVSPELSQVAEAGIAGSEVVNR
jgi:hypothetical protein